MRWYPEIKQKVGKEMKSNKLLYLSISSSILVFLYQFSQWKLVDIVTPFLMFPFFLLVFGFFIVVTVRALITLIKNKKWKPFVIQVITIILLFLIPFNQIILDMDFKLKKSERVKVVKMVEKGELKPEPESSWMIHLPKKYENLSSGGGEIVVEKSGNGYNILFFTYRGILDNFSGYVFTVKDRKPSKNAFGGDFKEIERMDKNWYFVSSY